MKFLFLCSSLLAASTLFAQGRTEQFYLQAAPFKMTQPVQPKFAAKSYALRNYGAVPDGQTLNTEAFAKAISACARGGGGKVVVPAGLWLTGPIELQSGVNLVVERGAVIQFTPDRTQYAVEKLNGSSSLQVRPPILPTRQRMWLLPAKASSTAPGKAGAR